MTAVTYSQWLEARGTHKEYGQTVLVMDQYIRNHRAIWEREATRIISELMTELSRSGHRPVLQVSLWIERDIALRAYEMGCICDTEQGDTPWEYVAMAYEAWQEEQAARIVWERKSLWQYIRYWWCRRGRDGHA